MLTRRLGEQLSNSVRRQTRHTPMRTFFVFSRALAVVFCLYLLSLTIYPGFKPSFWRPSFDKSSLSPDARGFVPWSDAKNAIVCGDVTTVILSDGLTVSIVFRDGTIYKATEDHLGEASHLIREYGLQDQISTIIVD